MRSKLSAVIRHEYMTIVKQPTFWLIMLAIPVLMAAVIGINYFSSKTMQDSIKEAAKDIDNVVVIDESGLINESIAASINIKLSPVSEKAAAIERIKSEKLEGLIVYPSDILKTRSYKAYTSSKDLNAQSSLTEFAGNLLKSSIYAPLGSNELIALAQQGASGNIIAYDNGEQTPGFAGYIVPGIFLVLFYMVLVFSVNYMLTSVSEEKENRSMEMVLSHVKPRTLIFGKLLGISLVTLTQLVFIAGFIALTYFVALQFNDQLNLPLSIDLSNLVFDPIRIIVGALVLVLGFVLFAALMAGVGSMVPSAKDAGGLSVIFIMGAIIPFYTFGIISSNPDSGLVQFMSYFPTTAPTTLLIRNTLGNIDPLEAAAAIAVLAVLTALSIALAGRLFKIGALEYANSLSIKQILWPAKNK